jgi:hypothetical protein
VLSLSSGGLGDPAHPGSHRARRRRQPLCVRWQQPHKRQ